MVIKKPAGQTGEIIGIQDVLHTGAQAAPLVRQMAPGEIDLARLEKWIVLADKGISLLGRAEAIVGPIIRERATNQQGEQVNKDVPRYGPGEGININAEKEGRPPTPDTPAVLPAASPPTGPPEIDPLQIAGTLRMIDGQMPGITAVQIAQLIEAHPEEVGRLMKAAMGGRK